VVVLDTTPFYAESGGQVGDQGVITSGSASFEVGDTQKIKADVFGHHGTLTQGTLAVGDTVNAQVNTAARAATVRNHSATHLMHKALREVLGEHVQQKGSLVDAERTRFRLCAQRPGDRRANPRDRAPRERRNPGQRRCASPRDGH
jgi:alanyl-tRNA synthetase